jgi:hAT family C-terminal dimerisation region
MVVADNATRWNTGYTMVKASLELKIFLDLFCVQHPELKRDGLTPDEWKQLEGVEQILKPFLDATLQMESRSVTIHNVIPLLEFLTSKYRATISQYARLNDTHIVQAANLGLAKLERYYNMIKSIPAYIAAVVLDPSSKFEFFETCSWHVSEIENAEKMVIELWRKNYKSSGAAQTDESGSQTTSQTVSQSLSRESGDGDFVEWRAKKRRVSDADELEQYLAMPFSVDSSEMEIIQWWYNKRDLWPMLSKMALDIFSIPSMSADAERLFSSGKLVLRDTRSRLSAESIAALETLKSWEKEGVISYPID